MISLESKLGGLLGDFSLLASRIKHLTFDTDPCGDRIDVQCSYIVFRDGQPTFSDFISTIADHIIPFCLPRSEIRKAAQLVANGDHVAAGRAMTQLAERARALFIKAKKGSSRSGEAGEIVLYILTEWLLEAPQIVSKMYLKTNNQMPVHGTDGIHARFDASTQKLYLYWGESKAHAKIASGLSAALESIADFVSNNHEQREIEIVSSYLDFDGVDQVSKEAFLRYLDPYATESNERVVVHSCLLVFDFMTPSAKNSGDAESIFVAQVKSEVASFIKTIKDRVADKGLSPQRFEFFLLPVPSVEDFRDKFQEKIGWPP